MTSPVASSHSTELTAVLEKIAALQAQQAALAPRIFILQRRAKALEAYARTLPEEHADAHA